MGAETCGAAERPRVIPAPRVRAVTGGYERRLGTGANLGDRGVLGHARAHRAPHARTYPSRYPPPRHPAETQWRWILGGYLPTGLGTRGWGTEKWRSAHAPRARRALP